MNFNKSLILAVSAGMLLGAVPADSFAKSKSKKNDLVVGSYASKFTIFVGEPRETNVFGVLTTNADGTFIAHASEFLTQNIGGVTGLNTIVTGAWKKIGKRRYKFVGSFVNLLRSILTPEGFFPVDCAALAQNPPVIVPCDCGPAAPACPAWRAKAEFILELNDDCRTSTFTGTVTRHPLDDLTLTVPAEPPFDSGFRIAGEARTVTA